MMTMTIRLSPPIRYRLAERHESGTRGKTANRITGAGFKNSTTATVLAGYKMVGKCFIRKGSRTREVVLCPR